MPHTYWLLVFYWHFLIIPLPHRVMVSGRHTALGPIVWHNTILTYHPHCSHAVPSSPWATVWPVYGVCVLPQPPGVISTLISTDFLILYCVTGFFWKISPHWRHQMTAISVPKYTEYKIFKKLIKYFQNFSVVFFTHTPLMKTILRRNAFRIIGTFWRKSTGHWFP